MVQGGLRPWVSVGFEASVVAMPVKQRARIVGGASGYDEADVNEVITGIDGLIDATIEPSNDLGQDRGARFSNFAYACELFRTFVVGTFAGKEIGKIALIFSENVHGKNTGRTNHGSRASSFVGAEQDQGWIERNRGKRARGHSVGSALVGGRDDRDAGGELSEGFTKCRCVYGHGGTVGRVEGLGEMIDFSRRWVVPTGPSSLVTRQAKCAANHADCGARHQEDVQGAGRIHHEARDGHEGHAKEHQKDGEKEPLGLAVLLDAHGSFPKRP